MRLLRLAALLTAFAVACAVMVFFLSLPSRHAYGRDDGRYANSPLKPWFDGLQSEKGLCCSFADGVKVEDVDWDTKDGKFRVRLCATPPPVADGPHWATCERKEWFEVPDAALVKSANKFGPAVVWPYADYSDGKPLTAIRCFIPGAGA